MKKILLLIPIFGFASFAWSTTQIATDYTEVMINQTHQKGGIITFTVDWNDYSYPGGPPGANTLFVRLRLYYQAKQQISQVGWPGYDDSLRQDPIHIPLELINAPEGSEIAAPPDAISIVRWLETEREVWLHVKHSSTFWIRNLQGGLVPPSEDNGFVQFKLGLSSDASFAYYLPLFQEGQANLPGATRDLDWVNNPTNPVFCTSPEWLIDLEDSELTACPNPHCELLFDIISLQGGSLDGPDGVFTAPIGGSIDNGYASTVQFVGDQILAVGVLGFAVPTLSNSLSVLLISLIGIAGFLFVKNPSS